MVVFEADQEAKDEGGGGRLERGCRKGDGGDEEVEEETGRGEPDEDTGDDFFDEKEVVVKGVAEEDECSLNIRGRYPLMKSKCRVTMPFIFCCRWRL